VGEQYPAEGFLDRLVAKGLTFTTASDAHQNERVGERASDLAAMLEARGVHEVASYTGRQRRMIPLRAN
jgi:histidinol-phosphatase (PHP family)